MNKEKKFLLVSVIVVGMIAFYFGNIYGQNQTKSSSQITRQFQGLTTGQKGVRTGFTSGNNFINGEVLSKDDSGVVIKLQEGGSKIILISSSSNINKIDTGTKNDIEIGKQISVIGTTNSDGSITAKTIQIK